MTINQKRKVALFLGLSLIVTAVFAISLSQMHLEPGQPSPLLEGSHIVVTQTSQSRLINLPIFTFILQLAGVVIALYLLAALFSAIMGMSWKKQFKMLKQFILVIAVLTILILALSLLRGLPGKSQGQISALPENNPPVFTTVDSPPLLMVWIIGISLALLAAILLTNWIRLRRRSRRNKLLSVEIEKARLSILAGMNLDEVILQCYREMVSIVWQEGGIERQLFTTPAEFESELRSAGLPRAPVQTLTALFESVRYGHLTPTHADEQEAINNLQAIASYLRKKTSAKE